MSGIEVIPSAKRLIKSLRDMGYDFPQAVADVVDNSIEAKASIVAIDIEFDGDNSWVRIADNGTGMKPDQLREAMRYGAERGYDADDLGKFGLGLKTASMSQCQCLSVASRWNPDRADIAAYSWDLEHIERTNKWEILPLDRNGLGPAIREPLKDTTGTVVLWQRLDRILGYKHPYGEQARKQLSRMCRDVEAHLAMVFHRFLSGEVRGRRLKLLLNGNEIKAWDPFCRTETKTKALQTIRVLLEHEGVSGEVLFEPFILPHKDDFSSSDAFNQASGPSNWNQQQGFYIYRAGRMIQSGGWSNLRAPDEHTKLARVAVSFAPKLDEAFKINVAKMRVQMPAPIREEVKNGIVAPLVRLAREVYDRKQPKVSATTTSEPAPVPTPQTIPNLPGGTSVTPAVAQTGNAPSELFLTLEEWARRILGAATEDERPVIEAVLERIRKSPPRR
ncbi:MAG: ATP-binding protein [Pseudomonadota bacterium]